MKQLSMQQHIIRLSLFIACILSGIIAIIFAFQVNDTQKKLYQSAQSIAKKATHEASTAIAKQLNELNKNENLSAEKIKYITEKSFPSRWGYVSIIAKDGTYIFHPNYEFVEQKLKAPDVARQKKNMVLAQNIEQAIKEEINFFNYTNLVSGQNSWMIFEPISSKNWYAAGTFIVDEMIRPTPKLTREIILLVTALAIFILFILLLILKIWLDPLHKLRIVSALFSISLLSIIAALWYKEFMDTGKGTDVILEKNVDFKKFIDDISRKTHTINPINSADQKAIEKSYHNDVLLSPAGIYIHKISIGTNSTSIVGYVWQKIPIDSDHTAHEGILLPQAQDLVREEAYSTIQGNWKTIGWSIRCTLQQNFDYTSYPFDYQKIKIQLWPTAPDNQIVLIPDLDSYKTINPTALPGVNSSIVLQSWLIDRSYFSLEQKNYLTNFGYHSPESYTITGSSHKNKLPELNFYIVATRHAISSLILYLLPIIVILVLLFIVMIMAAFIRFSHMLASLASLFFTSLIAYTTFKSSLPIQKIVFFDFLYFIVQLAIFTTSILAIMYHKKFNIRLINFNHMFIPQILFWPTINIAILITSFIYFY